MQTTIQATAEPLSSPGKRFSKSILYLLLSFPLGIAYLVFLLTGISLGLSLLIVWIGIPILFFVLYSWWGMARFERSLAINLLQAEVPPIEIPESRKPTMREWLSKRLISSMTWKTLAFLILKFPLGLLSFIFTINAFVLILVLAICTSVLTFLIAPFVYIGIVIAGKPLSFRLGKRHIHAETMLEILGAGVTGLGLALLPLYLLQGMVWIWKELARILLGMNDQTQRIARAEAKAREEQARATRAELSRQELIANVSHELRTPVASIRAHLESLLQATEKPGTRPLTPDTLHRYLTIVHRESVRLGTLVDDLLSLARNETDKLHLNMASVEADEVVEEVYQSLLPLARKERQITLIREIEPGIPRVKADRQRLRQVLLNLVRNAITYTPDGGIIAITLKQEKLDQVVLAVSDTGIGIPEEALEKIFDRFYRTDASRTRSSGGFGLGLAIVQDLVIAMGGFINVESKVGEGSSFRVILQTA
ncbi:sensor histidine kinase [Thermosporothrix hazakensis]|jgi:signal transduction histidine kinase|nr:sensor domain-containing protein [Thermosporothrix hazakensis]